MSSDGELNVINRSVKCWYRTWSRFACIRVSSEREHQATTTVFWFVLSESRIQLEKSIISKNKRRKILWKNHHSSGKQIKMRNLNLISRKYKLRVNAVHWIWCKVKFCCAVQVIDRNMYHFNKQLLALNVFCIIFNKKFHLEIVVQHKSIACEKYEIVIASIDHSCNFCPSHCFYVTNTKMHKTIQCTLHCQLNEMTGKNSAPTVKHCVCCFMAIQQIESVCTFSVHNFWIFALVSRFLVRILDFKSEFRSLKLNLENPYNSQIRIHDRWI